MFEELKTIQRKFDLASAMLSGVFSLLLKLGGKEDKSQFSRREVPSSGDKSGHLS